jgi:general secretion pathway protein I
MRPVRSGFTLLEVVVALAILGLSLMAIYDLNAGAVAMHAYSKKLTVASLLARSKMTDLEQDLYDKGFSTDDEEKSGDFSDEGWSSFKWRAKISAPKTDGVSPEQLLGAIFNLPLGGASDGSFDIAKMLGLSGGSSSSTPSGTPGASTTGAPTPTQTGLGGMAGIGAGLIQTQFTQLVDQITKSVREVQLTVTWKDGKQVETLDIVTHVVQVGQGGDRNGNLAAAAQAAAAQRLFQPPNPPPPGQPPLVPK